MLKAPYTFYIQTSSHRSDHEELVLTPSESGKTFVVDVRTNILLYLGKGTFNISQASTQKIFEYCGQVEPVYLPLVELLHFFLKG